MGQLHPRLARGTRAQWPRPPAGPRWSSARRDLDNIGDFGATLGGYIIKDRLWFFAGVQPRSSATPTRHYSQTRLDRQRTRPRRRPGDITRPHRQRDQRRFGDEKSLNYIGKLTFLLSTDHRLSVSVTGTPTTGGGDAAVRHPHQGRAAGSHAARRCGDLHAAEPSTLHILTNEARYNVGELNSSFLDKRLLLDVRAGWHHQLDQALPGTAAGWPTSDNTATLAGTPPTVLHRAAILTNVTHVEDQVPASVVAACAPTADDPPSPPGHAGWAYGGPGFIEALSLDSYQAKGIFTYLLNAAGHHVIKARRRRQLVG